MRRYFFFFILVFCAPLIFAHYPKGFPPASRIMQTTSKAASENLIQQTLTIDIQTAGYYELIEWCRQLDLPTKGTKKELQQTLYNFYGIQPEKEEPQKQPARVVTITSADKTEYFTMEEIDENYILLERGVLIELRDRDKEAVHTIQADRIFINQTQDLITANGNVEYTLEEKGKKDIFRGSSLTFNIKDWQGVFIKGISETERTIEEQEINFQYSGDTIYRSEKDIITLDKGVITSSKAKKPNYRLKASKIWVFSPGEWALLNPVLYIGHIPVLYFPFFFKAGDELFFHPAIGKKEPEGFFLQTTTYLLGEKEKKESSFSFLQTGESEEETLKKEIKGLYLRKTDPLSPAEKLKKAERKESGTFIKVLADAYSRLGFFAGIEGALRNFGTLEQYDFLGSFAFSRNIYFDSVNQTFTPFWHDENDILSSTWNKSSFFGTTISFRYGFLQTLKLRHEIFSLSGTFEYLSDPYFFLNFLDREEDVNWSKLVGLEEGENSETETPGTISDDSLKNSLKWNLNGTLTPKFEKANPYLTELSVTNLSVSMDWAIKDTNIEGITGLDPELPGYIPESSLTDYSFPEDKFYYPSSYQFPSVSMRISGTIKEKALKKDSETGQNDQKEEEPGKGFRPPWEEQEKKEEHSEEEEGLLRIPNIMEDKAVPVQEARDPFSHTLSYSIIPKATIDNRTAYEEWEKPSDIDFQKAYSLGSSSGTSSLTYNSLFYDQILTLKDTLSMSYDFRRHYNNTSIAEEDWQQLLEQDYSSSFFKLSDQATLSSKPFLDLSYIYPSIFSYTLGFIILTTEYRDFDEAAGPIYDKNTLSWDDESITQHAVQMDLKADLWNNTQSFIVSLILPPLLRDLTTTLKFITGPLESTFAWGIGEEETETETEWVKKPYELTEKFSFLENSYFQQYFSYDFEQYRWNTSKSTLHFSFLENNLSFNEEFTFGNREPKEGETLPPLFKFPTLSTTQLGAYGFSANLSLRRTYPYEFETETGWKQLPTERFIREKLTAGYSNSFQSEPLWKNRLMLESRVDTSYTFNFIKFTDNLFSLKLAFGLFIFDFLQLDISVSSENKNTYRYFQGLCDDIEQQRIPFFQDLKKSFSLFDTDAREEAFFKAKEIDITAVHKLQDWDLNFEFSGFPELITEDDGFKHYVWQRSFSIFVKWNPIPEIKKDIRYEDETIVF